MIQICIFLVAMSLVVSPGGLPLLAEETLIEVPSTAESESTPSDLKPLNLDSDLDFTSFDPSIPTPMDKELLDARTDRFLTGAFCALSAVFFIGGFIAVKSCAGKKVEDST